MSALSIPTCGRPGGVSSILTAMVGVVGTAPIPVYGLTALGAAGAGVDAVAVVEVAVDVDVGVGDSVFVLCPEPPHAVRVMAATVTPARPTALTVRGENFMSDPSSYRVHPRRTRVGS